MRTSIGLLLTPFVLVVGSALAQSNPYAGSWSGTASYRSSATCTCSGSPNCPPPTTIACTATVPWTATIDAQGNTNFGTGAGTEDCGGGVTIQISANATQFLGQLPASGAISFPGGTTTFQGGSSTCNTFTIQFALTPPSVNGAQQCTSTSSNTNTDGSVFSCTGTFSDTFTGGRSTGGATSPPPFPMTVQSSITPTTANATAQVQPPSQLVGTNASVYVFAHARLSTLKSTPLRLADSTAPDPCVLAQLNANGQLVAAGGSQLSAYTTGVISSQGQSVTILNNVSTPTVAGASFFVGYGQTSNAMLSGGVYQGAVTVPGTNSCSTALLAGSAPNNAGPLSGQWWNPNESGWGMSLSQRNKTVFAAWYTYDGSGNPKWYVASNCAMASASTSGTCNGQLYEVSGPTFFGTSFNPSLVHVTPVGTLLIRFTDANNGSMSYTVNGQSRSIAIQRQVFQTGTIPPAVDYTDLWWNPNESGWGIAATQQYGVMFLAWFVYDSNSKPVWYVATNCTVVGSGCSGTLYKTSGPPFGPTFNAAAVQANPVGTISASFTDANNATINYTVNGVSASKTITRQVF